MRPTPTRALLAALLPALLALGVTSPAAAAPRIARVATLADGPWQGATVARLAIAKEIAELVGAEAQVLFPPELQRDGAWSVDSVAAQLDALLAAPEVDVVIALGALGSHIASRRPTLAHPVVAAAIIDADIQRMPREGRGSGRPDLAYITDDIDVARDLEAFRAIADFDRLALLSGESYLQAMPELAMEFQRQAKAQGIELSIVGVGADPAAAVQAVPADAQAVYVTALPRLNEDQYRALAAGLIERGLPSFALRGYPDVEWGLLSTLTPPVDLDRYLRRVSLAAHQIIIGEPAGRLPVDFERGEQLVINADTARGLDLALSWQVLTEAVLLGADPADLGRKLTLVDAVEAALAGNRGLRASRSTVHAEEVSLEKSRAPWLPKVEGELATRVIDADRAKAGFGQAPQFQGTGKLTVSQLVYDHGAWVNRDLQRDLQRSREEGLAAEQLDVVRDTAVAWFDVLRARTGVAIQRANLRLSRQNLATARTRARLGAGRTVDIHRWEAQIANEKQSVIDADSHVELAMMVLAQQMGAPLEEGLSPVPIRLDDPTFITSRPTFVTRLSTPRGFARFRDFMAREALENAPELRQIDAALEATERRAALARRYWLPSVGVQAELEQQLFEAGDGQDASESVTIDPSLAATLSPDSITIASADTTNWFVGLSVRLPLYEGGENWTEMQEADARLVELRHQRAAAVERIEQRVRIAVHRAGSAFPRIELSQEAAVAARRSRDIALDAYGRGAIDEVSLLDVQNTARVSEALAANSVYDFLVLLMDVHRAVGAFYFLRSPDDKAAFERRFIAFMDGEPSTATPAAAPPAPAQETP